LCVEGKKLVLFVTGLCPRKCVYCPLSDKKKDKDVTYANEWPTKKDEEILEEAKLIGAEGAGFTGGDPLVTLDKTIHYIRLLKENFGKKFHIHLYTSLDIADEEKFKKLFDAGLDEIRFHLDIDDKTLWPKILLAKKFDWDVGVEIPSIPNKINQTKELIDYLADKITFLNLNELEINEDQVEWFKAQGFKTKNYLSYAIEGSEKAGFELLRYAEKKGIKNIHYCSATTKDKHQMANRIIRRAIRSKKSYDKMTKEGMLIRGAIYYEGDDWKTKLLELQTELNKELKPEEHFFDEKNKRILISHEYVRKHRTPLKKEGFKPAIVEEYPTWDNFPIELEYL